MKKTKKQKPLLCFTCKLDEHEVIWDLKVSMSFKDLEEEEIDHFFQSSCLHFSDLLKKVIEEAIANKESSNDSH